jgi:hypothetical protein
VRGRLYRAISEARGTSENPLDFMSSTSQLILRPRHTLRVCGAGSARRTDEAGVVFRAANLFTEPKNDAEPRGTCVSKRGILTSGSTWASMRAAGSAEGAEGSTKAVPDPLNSARENGNIRTRHERAIVRGAETKKTGWRREALATAASSGYNARLTARMIADRCLKSERQRMGRRP